MHANSIVPWAKLEGVSGQLKNFKARAYCYLSSFLFDNCRFLLFERLSGHCGIWLLFPMAIKEKLLPDDTCHKK